MTEKLTWAEFVEKYQPEQGDKFLDDRGHYWNYSKIHNEFYSGNAIVNCKSGNSGHRLTCPLIPPKKKRKMWPAMVKLELEPSMVKLDHDLWQINDRLFESIEDAKKYFSDKVKVIWPAISGPDGSYEIDE